MKLSDYTVCERCGYSVEPYDRVRRIVKEENGAKRFIFVYRVRCPVCGHIVRVLPDILFRYKHYRKDIIEACQRNKWDVDISDYPCDDTLKRWKREIIGPLYEVKSKED